RNIISYVLQKIATEGEGKKLEATLIRTGSAYAVQITKKQVNASWSKTEMKLIYRVDPIVAKQAVPILNSSSLIQEAWDAYYGLKPDYEKVVTRSSDALAGLLRDKFFPDEQKPQLGKLIEQLQRSPEKISFPGES